jgi:hypothetical protein
MGEKRQPVELRLARLITAANSVRKPSGTRGALTAHIGSYHGACYCAASRKGREPASVKMHFSANAVHQQLCFDAAVSAHGVRRPDRRFGYRGRNRYCPSPDPISVGVGWSCGCLACYSDLIYFSAEK